MVRLFAIIVALLSVVVAAAEPLPAYVIQLPESIDSVLIAETDTATLHRYERTAEGVLAVAAQRMSIGQRGVGKQRSGDRRTPLGVYFIVEELDTRNLHEKYGPVAFPLDYPNAWDKALRRTGDGIWIHGVTPGSGPRPKLDTDGCIALANDELLSLQQYLRPLQTPVIVTRSLALANPAELAALREQLSSALTEWAASYRSGDWGAYLNLYAEEFQYRGMSRDEWTAYRAQTVATQPLGDLVVDDVLIFADPEEPGLYLSRFRQQLKTAGRTIATTKRLYWRAAADGAFKIVAEDNG